MRRTRPLLLLLIVAIGAVVAFTYRIQRSFQIENTPAAPPTLPETLNARAFNWSRAETKDGKPVVEVSARNYRMVAEGTKMELEGVQLKLYHKDGQAYDEVKSEKADYDVTEGILFSDGGVEITMGVSAPDAVKKTPTGKLVVVKTSGVRFESKTGKAYTERAASFRFDRGEGQSTGAEYDPQKRELLMQKDVQLHWRGSDPAAKPMNIAAGALIYKEQESKVLLLNWSKFDRQTLHMDAGPAVVSLKDGVIQQVEAQQARGADTAPKRDIQYAAAFLLMDFNDKGVVNRIQGSDGAELTSTAPAVVTTVSSNRLDLQFEAVQGESILKTALATGSTVINSKPREREGVLTADTRILRSETVSMAMRPGGEEIDKVETQSPGQIEFVPNRAGQRHRVVFGERMDFDYGPANQLKAFRAHSVWTRSDSLAKDQPPSLTWSKEMSASFDPKDGAMQQIEQWDAFRYEEGERRARSNKAILESATNLITLDGAARAWDPSGSTAADRIQMHQTTGDFQASGNVNSTRLPENEKKPAKKGGLLGGDEPLQAKAARMVATEDRQRIEYTGDAFLWQGPNRLQSDRVVIDRKSGELHAFGKVRTQLLDKKETRSKTPVFTAVEAPKLDYSDKERIAHYTGGSILNRSNTVVNARQIRAYLKEEEGGGSSLEKAFADGGVRIVQTAPGRTRTGTSEHAEFYPGEGRTILNGGIAEMVDTVSGTTRGPQLTYFSEEDRLLVEGAESSTPIRSKLPRRK